MLIIILKLGTRLFCSCSLGLVTMISMGEIQDGCTMIKVYVAHYAFVQLLKMHQTLIVSSHNILMLIYLSIYIYISSLISAFDRGSIDQRSTHSTNSSSASIEEGEKIPFNTILFALASMANNGRPFLHLDRFTSDLP